MLEAVSLMHTGLSAAAVIQQCHSTGVQEQKKVFDAIKKKLSSFPRLQLSAKFCAKEFYSEEKANKETLSTQPHIMPESAS